MDHKGDKMPNCSLIICDKSQTFLQETITSWFYYNSISKTYLPNTIYYMQWIENLWNLCKNYGLMLLEILYVNITSIFLSLSFMQASCIVKVKKTSFFFHFCQFFFHKKLKKKCINRNYRINFKIYMWIFQG